MYGVKKTRVINYVGTVAINALRTEVTQIRLGRWRITRLRITFLPGQSNSLFVRPQAVDIGGAVNDLFQPAVEVTGDDWSLVINDIPYEFEPGSSVCVVFRNSSDRHARLYNVQIEMEEIN